MSIDTTHELSALLSDLEHSASQLSCSWQTTLHHNNHVHSDPPDTNCTSAVTISPLGCAGQTYYYSVVLKVTYSARLSTTQEVLLHPDCQSLSPILRYLGRDEASPIRWQLTGDSARTYLIEGSTNLVDWSQVTSIVPLSGSVEFSDPSASNLNFRFYRAILVPRGLAKLEMVRHGKAR